jgi:hypothetical protein
MYGNARRKCSVLLDKAVGLLYANSVLFFTKLMVFEIVELWVAGIRASASANGFGKLGWMRGSFSGV